MGQSCKNGREARAVTDIDEITEVDALGLYLVRSESGEVYEVEIDDENSCTCADYQYREAICKHIRAVQMDERRRLTPQVVR